MYLISILKSNLNEVKKTACKYIIITHHRLRLLTHCKWECKQAQMYWQSLNLVWSREKGNNV